MQNFAAFFSIVLFSTLLFSKLLSDSVVLSKRSSYVRVSPANLAKRFDENVHAGRAN